MKNQITWDECTITIDGKRQVNTTDGYFKGQLIFIIEPDRVFGKGAVTLKGCGYLKIVEKHTLIQFTDNPFIKAAKKTAEKILADYQEFFKAELK